MINKECETFLSLARASQGIFNEHFSPHFYEVTYAHSPEALPPEVTADIGTFGFLLVFLFHSVHLYDAVSNVKEYSGATIPVLKELNSFMLVSYKNGTKSFIWVKKCSCESR